MNNYKYTLQAATGAARRHRCPACGKPNVFKRYISTATGQYVDDTVGRCNREIKCGYHYTPRQFFAANPTSEIFSQFPKSEKVRHPKLSENTGCKDTPVSVIPAEQFLSSLDNYGHNSFVSFLRTVLGREEALQAVERYYIGTSAHWPGACIFWQIDTDDNKRTGKVMLYNAQTGKRVKQPFNHINWVHKLSGEKDYKLEQCFFGEHLLRDNNKTVAIVESEKTAIIASVYFPKYVWLASGSLANLNAAKCAVLRNREVILFPDINGYKKWAEKLWELCDVVEDISVSDMLERIATAEEREAGLDLADYLLQFPVSDFANEPESVAENTPPAVGAGLAPARETCPNTGHPQSAAADYSSQSVIANRLLSKHPALRTLIGDHPFIEIIPAPHQPSTPPVDTWDKDIALLREYFSQATLPDTPIRISKMETISNVPRFVEAHFSMVEFNKGKKTFLPYLERLQILMERLKAEPAVVN